MQYDLIIWLIFSQYLIKITYETLMTPFSVKTSLWLKKNEQVDIYDINTNFSLFSFSIDDSKHVNKFNAT